jgi:iron complex transport system substrate-binding protein
MDERAVPGFEHERHAAQGGLHGGRAAGPLLRPHPAAGHALRSRWAKLALSCCVLLAATGHFLAARAAEPQRIISLAPSITETVFALGLGDRLVGVSVYCDYPPAAEHIDKVGSFLTPNVEPIIAKRPDVVLAVPSPGNRGGVEALRQLGIRVVVVNANTLGEIRDAILTVGRELDRESQARALLRRIDDQFAAVTQRLGDVPPRRVLMVVGQAPLIAVGSGTFQGELIEKARGVNVAKAAGSAWPHLSLEYVIAAAPEVIIDTTMGDEERPGADSAMAFWRAFPSIPALRDGRVYGYKAYQLLRPGPRIGEAFADIARFVHPERFDQRAGDD